ncbi:MAG TPA: DnaJ domain-containing protein [Blastocatellia bacterium]|nr:DnaJ domain-containing protein [Blastocatellia bacterium]
MGQTVIDKVRRSAQVIAEVERVLACMRNGADHYQVLDISRDASIDVIRKAYCKAVEQIHPHKCRDLIDDDGVIRWKLSQAFLRVSEAFSTLSRPARRIEYDSQFTRRPVVPLPLPSIPGPLDSLPAPEIKPASVMTDPDMSRFGLGNAFGQPNLHIPAIKDRRATERLILRVPVRVVADGRLWEEVAESRDVSRGGIRLCLSHAVEVNECLLLEFPMPLALRVHSFSDSLYSVRAIVRHGTTGQRGTFLAGAEFQEP